MSNFAKVAASNTKKELSVTTILLKEAICPGVATFKKPEILSETSSKVTSAPPKPA